MGYVTIVRRPHQCYPPMAALAVLGGMDTGTKWQCDDCGRISTLVKSSTRWEWQ